MKERTMPETKFTPGPWKPHTDMDGRHLGYAITSEAPEFKRDENWPYHPRIAVAEHSKGSAPMEVAKANARLIAASPRMFAYIQKRANEGDQDAAEIIASIER